MTSQHHAAVLTRIELATKTTTFMMTYNVDQSIDLIISALALNTDSSKLAIYAYELKNDHPYHGALYGFIWTVHSSDGRQ